METSVNSSSPSPSTKIVNNIQSTHKTKLSSLKDSFKCELCGGYIINATTINECLHSFCRSCIVKHFNRNHDCPKCGLKFSETSKWETLRMDSMLQSLIYKLIPGLFRSEMKLRREFHSKSNDSQCDYFDEQKVYYQLDEKISVVLMYSKYCYDKSKKMIGPSKGSTSTSTTSSDEHRYLLCPAGFPIASLKKFICLKYELSSCFKVDIMFDDKILDDDLQLLDIVYLYSTQQPIPLHFKLNNFAVHKNNQTTTTSKSQINAIKKSVNNHQLSSPNSTSLTSSSSSSSSSSSTKTSASTVTQSSTHFHMKTTTTTSTASTNTPNNGNAKNDVKNDNTTLKSVAVQSSSVITCATSPMNPVSSSTPTDTSTPKSASLSSQNIDQKNQLEKVTQISKLVNEREKQAMHSVSSCIKPTDTKRVIKPKVINTKLAPMVNQINLKRSTTSVLPCSTQVTTVTLNKQSKPSTVKTNKQSNMFVKSVELTNRETNKRFMNGYDNIGLTPISCSQSTPKVTSTATVSSTPSVSITATTMITTTSHGAKNNFISKHLSQMNNESEKRKESDCKSDKSEGPRKQMKVSQVNDKINSVTSSNQNDSSKSPSAPTSPKASSTQINTIDKAASNNVVNKITRDVNENCKTSHSVGTSISPNNSQTSVNAPKSVPSPVITNTISAGNSNVSSSKSQNNKNHQSTNGEVKSNGIKVDDKVVKSSNTNAIKAPSVSSSQSSTVTSKPLSSSSSSSSPHLVIAPSPSPSTSSSSPSPKLSSTTSVTSSKPSTSTSSSSSCTSTLTPTSTKVVSSSFYPTTTSTSTSTSTSISRLINNQQQKVKQSGQGDKRHRESPSSPSPGNAPDNRPSKMVKISKNQTLNSQHKSLQIQHQQQHQKQQQQQLQQFKLHQQMIGNHDQLANDSVFNVKALIADEKEAALNKNSPQTGFTLKSMPVDLRNPRNVNKSGGLHAIPSGPFQHFHHFANPSSVLVPIATGSSGHSPGSYHESTFPNMAYLEYSKLLKLTSEALMQHLQQANNAPFGINLNLNSNGNVNGKSIGYIEGERGKGFYKETLCNSPNRENGTNNDKNG